MTKKVVFKGTWERVPGLVLISHEDNSEIRKVLWESIVQSVELCFPNKDPNQAQGWIVGIWGFQIKTYTGCRTWNVSLKDERNPGKRFYFSQKIESTFWGHFLRFMKHEMDEWLEIDGRKPFHPHKMKFDRLRYRKRSKKPSYFF